MSKKKTQKKVVQKDGAINSEEKAVERINSFNKLKHAKELNKPVVFLNKNTNTGEVVRIPIKCA